MRVDFSISVSIGTSISSLPVSIKLYDRYAKTIMITISTCRVCECILVLVRAGFASLLRRVIHYRGTCFRVRMLDLRLVKSDL